jgi:hypothetical protein
MAELQPATMTQPPSELLRQVALYMRGKDTDISVTVPTNTTWKTVLRTTDAALGERDGSMTVTMPRTEAQRRRIRQLALENVAAWEAESSSSAETLPGRPIRTQYDTSSLPKPKPASREVVQRLKENMIPFEDMRDPYPIVLTAAITDKTLPIVKANITLNGIDSEFGPGQGLGLVDMLWDTGAQSTIVTDDILPDQFRRFLQEPSHDAYRSADKLRVQMDGIVAFSNTLISITAIALVVPKSTVPNQRSGVIFGQKQCIDRISYRSIPRAISKAKNEDIDEEVWGDLIIDAFVNENDKIVYV